MITRAVRQGALEAARYCSRLRARRASIIETAGALTTTVPASDPGSRAAVVAEDRARTRCLW